MEDLVELVYNGAVIGVFTNEEAAKAWMDTYHGSSSYSIVPIGTHLHTDIDDEDMI